MLNLAALSDVPNVGHSAQMLLPVMMLDRFRSLHLPALRRQWFGLVCIGLFMVRPLSYRLRSPPHMEQAVTPACCEICADERGISIPDGAWLASNESSNENCTSLRGCDRNVTFRLAKVDAVPDVLPQATNIGLNNLSLTLISLSLNQVIRYMQCRLAFCPGCGTLDAHVAQTNACRSVILISKLFQPLRPHRSKLASRHTYPVRGLQLR